MPDGVRTRNNKKHRSITFFIHRVIHSTGHVERGLKSRRSLFSDVDRAEKSPLASPAVDNNDV